MLAPDVLEWTAGKLVITNPPFSIFRKIVRAYQYLGIDYSLVSDWKYLLWYRPESETCVWDGQMRPVNKPKTGVYCCIFTNLLNAVSAKVCNSRGLRNLIDKDFRRSVYVLNGERITLVSKKDLSFLYGVEQTFLKGKNDAE